jgi:alkanesulfonate monooxygenase SsuD/methylene tetrahydromethanopterin reductase-like flavin-dependent oxidoreductase (luciferase family)
MQQVARWASRVGFVLFCFHAGLEDLSAAAAPMIRSRRLRHARARRHFHRRRAYRILFVSLEQKHAAPTHDDVSRMDG